MEERTVKGFKLIRMTVANFMKIEAAYIEPTGHLTVIAGPNEAGKTSLMRALWCVFGGKDATPDQPIREGAERGRVEVEVSEGDDSPTLVVERLFTPSNTYLKVSEKRQDGTSVKFDSPQKMLSALYESLTFDPLAFSKMEPRAQGKLLAELTGLDTSDLDAKYKEVYDERALVNRDIKAMGECPLPEGERPVMVDVAELAEQLRVGDKHNRKRRDDEATRGLFADALERDRSDVKERRDRALRLREQADELDRKAGHDEAETNCKADKFAELAPLPDPFDPTETQTELASAESRNAAVPGVRRGDAPGKAPRRTGRA